MSRTQLAVSFQPWKLTTLPSAFSIRSRRYISGNPSSSSSSAGKSLPLQGITVVSLEHAIAAPFCTRQLADLGARVIKVERPGVGDFARAYDRRVKGQASHFV